MIVYFSKFFLKYENMFTKINLTTLPLNERANIPVEYNNDRYRNIKCDFGAFKTTDINCIYIYGLDYGPAGFRANRKQFVF